MTSELRPAVPIHHLLSRRVLGTPDAGSPGRDIGFSGSHAARAWRFRSITTTSYLKFILMKMTILNIAFVAGPVILALVGSRTAAARRRARLWQAQVD